MAVLMSSILISSMSAVIPCFAQKSSISCVSLIPPTSLPPTSLRPANLKMLETIFDLRQLSKPNKGMIHLHVLPMASNHLLRRLVCIQLIKNKTQITQVNK